MKTSYNTNMGFNMRSKLSIIGLLLLLIYGIWNARIYLQGPSIEILSIKNNMETTTNPIEISGIAKNTSLVELNGRSITIDKSGLFKEQILLDQGLNEIIMHGRDRFGKNVDIEMKVYYKI